MKSHEHDKLGMTYNLVEILVYDYLKNSNIELMKILTNEVKHDNKNKYFLNQKFGN